MKKICVGLALTTITLTALPTSAEQFWWSGKILKTLTDSVAYGGCMLYMDTSSPDPDCNNHWVSLDCNGIFFSQRSADQKYAAGLAAFAANKTISLYVDDTKKVNGSYCVARRIDVSQ